MSVLENPHSRTSYRRQKRQRTHVDGLIRTVIFVEVLNKILSPDRLWAMIEDNYWNIEQPIESIEKKRKKQMQRRKTKDVEEFVDGDWP